MQQSEKQEASRPLEKVTKISTQSYMQSVWRWRRKNGTTELNSNNLLRKKTSKTLNLNSDN